MPGLNGLRLDVLGGQQLIFEGSDIGNTFLLEGLQASIKCFLEQAVTSSEMFFLVSQCRWLSTWPPGVHTGWVAWSSTSFLLALPG